MFKNIFPTVSKKSITLLQQSLSLSILLCVVVPAKSYAVGVCVREGLNLAYQSLPSDVVSCLALEIEDISLPPVSTKVDSMPVDSNLWAYANLTHECTVELGHDSDALFSTYIAEAFVRTNKYCKESIDFEVEKEAFEEFVFGEEFLSWETGSKPRDEKFTASMDAPLTLGRGQATQDQIESCISAAEEAVARFLPEAITRCFADENNHSNENNFKACVEAKGVTDEDVERQMFAGIRNYAGDICILMHNYRMTEADLEVLTPGTEKYQHRIESLK